MQLKHEVRDKTLQDKAQENFNREGLVDHVKKLGFYPLENKE